MANESEGHAVIFTKMSKFFGEHQVLKELSFSLHRGKITSILGFSGAGKSTLLKHILGLQRPSSGKVEVLGHNLNEMGQFELREFRQKFGMLFQYAALFDSLNTFENIAFPIREFTKAKKPEIEERVHALLDAVGLERKFGDRLPSELSGGMRKRVGLARALALNPEIILYDEPTTGLDPITTKMVNDLIAQTAANNEKRRLTSVIISHDVQATLRISDYVAFLERGELIEHLPVSEFRETKNPTIRKFLDL